jgi:hypothetical protein
VEGAEASVADNSISYVHVRDQQPGNLVYPFDLGSPTGAG